MSVEPKLPQSIASLNEQDLINQMQLVYLLAQDLYIDGELQLDPLGPRAASGLLVETCLQYTDSDSPKLTEAPYRLITIWGSVTLDYTKDFADSAVQATAKFQNLVHHRKLIPTSIMHGTVYSVHGFGSHGIRTSGIASFEPVNPRAVQTNWSLIQSKASRMGAISFTTASASR